MLVSTALPNIIGGVSQQPPALRVVNAHEEVINTWPSLVSGLQKRPGSQVIARLGSAITGTVKHHTYNDPVSGQTFFLIVQDNSLRVFNQFGVEKTISGSMAGSYLNFLADPKKNCRLLTVGDTTFILNRKIIPTTSAVTEASPRVNPVNRWTVFVSEAVPNAYYTLYVNGVQKATMLTKNNLDATKAVEKTSEIAESLRAQLATAGYTVTRYNSTLALTVAGGLKVEVYQDGNAGKALKVYSTSVPAFTDLPPQEEVGRILLVQGDPNEKGDDYFVQFSSDGRWIETYGYGSGTTINAATMPMKLVYNQGTDTFSLSTHTWGPRLVGDTTTSPPPSFIGNTISSLVVFRGRMGFLSDENAVFSEANLYENFWRTTVIQLLDDDPIDLSVVSGRVSVLNHAVPFNKKLVLFADQAQYILDTGDVLSPKTAVAAFSTAFQNSINQVPVNVGPYVYFIDDSGVNLRLMEYFTDNNAQTENADDASIQIPEYMVGPVRNMAGSSRLSTIFVQGAADNALYTYRFTFGDQQKIQSSWGTWTFNGQIKAFEFVDASLYLFINRLDGLYLERVGMEEDAKRTLTAFPVDLDQKITLAACTRSFSASTGKTTITLPYAYPTSLVALVLAPAATNSGIQFPMTLVSGNVFTVDGDVTAFTDAIIGQRYSFSWVLSTQYMREQKGQGMVVIQDGRLSMRYLSVQYKDTSAFTIKVTHTNGQVYQYQFEGRTLGSSGNILGSLSLDTGKFRVPIMGQSELVTIEVVNDTPYHCAFTGIEWQGQWRPKSAQRF